jgi:CRP-like cAMP-binding protein
MILKGRVEVWIKINKGYKADGTADFDMKKVAELDVGKSFGELAIMDESIKPRAATIIAKEDCIFGVLDRKTYKSILGKYHRLETFAKIQFLQEMPIFLGWTFHEIKSWVYLFEIKTKHKRKTVIYKEGDACDLIYLVKSGEVKVTKVVNLNYRPGEAEELMMDDTKSLLVFEKDPIRKPVEIVTITPGHMFGEEEAWAAYKMDQEILKWSLLEERQTKAKRKDSTISDSDSDASSALAKKEDSPVKKEDPLKKFKLPTRVTTITVQSYEAEIWAIPRKVPRSFFCKS